MNATQNVEATEDPKAETKAPKQHPCLCSKLEVLVNVHEDESGGLVWDEEHTTGCDPDVLTSKTFRPGHDATAVSFLLKAYREGWEVSLLEGGVRTSASPEIMAVSLGDALRDKFSRAVANFNKKEAAKKQRAQERAARAEAAQKAKELISEVESARAEANEAETGE